MNVQRYIAFPAETETPGVEVQLIPTEHGNLVLHGAYAAEARRLDWIVSQCEDFSFFPLEGEWCVFGSESTGRGKTFRDAIDSAIEAAA